VTQHITRLWSAVGCGSSARSESIARRFRPCMLARGPWARERHCRPAPAAPSQKRKAVFGANSMGRGSLIYARQMRVSLIFRKCCSRCLHRDRRCCCRRRTPSEKLCCGAGAAGAAAAAADGGAGSAVVAAARVAVALLGMLTDRQRETGRSHERCSQSWLWEAGRMRRGSPAGCPSWRRERLQLSLL